MRILLLLLFASLVGCKSNRGNAKLATEFQPVFSPGPPTLLYKTTKDYSNLVPVLLSDDKSTIISYPHPSDIKVGDKYSVPTPLSKGYLLDNRGIGKNVAFLKYTYEEYGKLDSAPEPSELYKAIIDKEPLIEMCHCGNRNTYKDVVAELNKAIEQTAILRKCKKL